MAQFKTWLQTQQIRPDTIGRFAQAAMSDPEFPDANNPTLHLNYLSSKGANKKLLLTLQQAYKEFGEFQARERDGIPQIRKTAKITQIKKEPAKAKSAPAAPKVTQAVTKPGKSVKEKPLTQGAPLKKVKPEKAQKVEAVNEEAQAKTTAKTEVIPNAPVKRKKTKVPANLVESEKPALAITVEKPEQAPRKIPAYLEKHKKQLADAAFLLDNQFGKGFAKENPGKVIDLAASMASDEQATLLRNFFRNLGEALIGLSKK